MKRDLLQKGQRNAFLMAIAFLALLFGCLNSPSFAEEKVQGLRTAIKDTHLVSYFEGGKLFSAGKFALLEVSGSYRQMGRQYGHLLSSNMKGMYEEIIRQFAENVPSKTDIHEFSRELYKLYPRRFQEIAEGMSETSGMDMDKIVVLNEFMDYFLCFYVPPAQHDCGHCSAITAWDRYSPNRTVVMGRNFDFSPFFRAFNKYLTVVAYNPSDGCNSAAVITYPGQIGSIQVFNSKGLVLENNNGTSCGDSGRYFGKRIPSMIKDLAAMFDCSSIESLDAALVTSRMPYPLIYNVAFPGGAYTYEMATYDVKQRRGENGLLIGTNHFLVPGWKPFPEEFKAGIEDSKLRYENLKNRADEMMGRIDAAQMMRIMDLPTEKGGATPMKKVIYQFVANPGEMKIWLKSLTYCDWTEIDLRAVFRK